MSACVAGCKMKSTPPFPQKKIKSQRPITPHFRFPEWATIMRVFGASQEDSIIRLLKTQKDAMLWLERWLRTPSPWDSSPFAAQISLGEICLLFDSESSAL